MTMMTDSYPWVTIDENGKEFRTHSISRESVVVDELSADGWFYDPTPDKN